MTTIRPDPMPSTPVLITTATVRLFEEPATLEVVVELASEWYRGHVPPPAG